MTSPSASRPLLVISGASGLIGRHLVHAARARYDLRLLTRNPTGDAPPGTTQIGWSPRAAREGDEPALAALREVLEGATAIVNLAGASVAAGRLNGAHQRRVLGSRIEGAATLLAASRRCSAPPKVWFQASATGYYGDQGDAELSEHAPPGRGVLSDICRQWEAAPGDANGARLIVGRLGVVLAKDAPAWQKLLLPIKLFAGGPLGSGQQWLPWIDADDLAQAMLFLLERQASAGVYNLTAPEPVRQIELTRKAARRLSRPARLPVPAFALRLLLGHVADALLLASAKVRPQRLQREGFRFTRPSIDVALDNLL